MALLGVFIWWLAFTIHELAETIQWSSLFNRPFSDFEPDSVTRKVPSTKNNSNAAPACEPVKHTHRSRKPTAFDPEPAFALPVATTTTDIGAPTASVKSCEDKVSLKSVASVAPAKITILAGKIDTPVESPRLERNQKTEMAVPAIVMSGEADELIEKQSLRSRLGTDGLVQVGTNGVDDGLPKLKMMRTQSEHSVFQSGLDLKTQQKDFLGTGYQKMYSEGAASMYEVTLDHHSLTYKLFAHDLRQEANDLLTEPAALPELTPLSSKRKRGRYELESMAGSQSLHARNVNYFRNFWNRVDWVIITSFAVFLGLKIMLIFFKPSVRNFMAGQKGWTNSTETWEEFKGQQDATLKFIEKLLFSFGTGFMVFRVLEHIGNQVSTMGPFIRAFIKIFAVMIFFMFMITIVAMACAIAISHFVCEEPTQFKFADNMDDRDKAECEKLTDELNRGIATEDHFHYRKCVVRIFKHFVVQPFGCNRNKQCEYAIFKDRTFDNKYMPCYGEAIGIFIDGVQMFYYACIIQAIMRGVLVKFLLGSRGDEETIALIHRTRSYMRCCFSQIDHPIPWNLIPQLVQCTVWLIETIDEGRKRLVKACKKAGKTNKGKTVRHRGYDSYEKPYHRMEYPEAQTLFTTPLDVEASGSLGGDAALDQRAEEPIRPTAILSRFQITSVRQASKDSARAPSQSKQSVNSPSSPKFGSRFTIEKPETRNLNKNESQALHRAPSQPNAVNSAPKPGVMNEKFFKLPSSQNTAGEEQSQPTTDSKTDVNGSITRSRGNSLLQAHPVDDVQVTGIPVVDAVDDFATAGEGTRYTPTRK